MINPAALNTVDRRDIIIRLIKENGKVQVAELTSQFNVSSVTIRNDLNYLERKGLIDRVYGGALARVAVAYDSALTEKAKLHVDEKRRIGAKAAEMIYDGDSIILDSGTTTLEIAKRIKDKRDLTVMTNGVNIATELAGNSHISVLLTGGILRENSFSLVGPQAEAVLMDFYYDKLFLGVDGFDLGIGLTTPNQLEAHLNAIMVGASKETIVVADSSKFGRQSLCRISGPEEVTRIITDTGISEEYLDSLAGLGIEIIRV
jgi:DeoR family transcriptional regulator of aga operon